MKAFPNRAFDRGSRGLSAFAACVAPLAARWSALLSAETPPARDDRQLDIDSCPSTVT
jgi:hypothetical protein